MRTHQPHAAVQSRGHVVRLFLGDEVREFTPNEARQLADALSDAADVSEVQNNAYHRALNARTIRARAQPARDGYVRLGMGPHALHLSASQAVRLADSLVWSMKEAGRRNAAGTATDTPDHEQDAEVAAILATVSPLPEAVELIL